MRKIILVSVCTMVSVLVFHAAKAGPLHVAASKGDLIAVQQLVQAGADIKAEDEQGNSAIRSAVMGGKVEVVKFLIEQGADINERKYEISLIRLAAGSSVKVANYLLSMEVGKTPFDMELLLGRAAFEGDVKTITSLLKEEINIDSYAMDEYSGEDEVANPLGYAIKAGRLNIMDLLLKHGAEVDSNHINLAICSGKTRLLQVLLKQGVNDNNKYEQLPDNLSTAYLDSALKCGNKEVLSYLLERIKEINYAGLTNSLKYASGKISVELFATVFARDADIKLHASELLPMAITAGNYKLATFLFNKGGTLTQENIDYAMLTVAQEGFGEMLELLLKTGGRKDIRSGWGNTPLLRAVPYNRINTVAILLKNGADVNAKNELLNTPLHMAAARNLAEMATLLIENGARVNAINEDGNMPLHQAVRYSGQLDMIKLLLINKAKINARNGEGMTALHLFALQNPDCKIQARESARDTLHARVTGNSEEDDSQQRVEYWQRPQGGYFEGVKRIEAIKYLLEAGADLNIRDKDGRTAFEIEEQCSKDAEFVNYLRGKLKPAAGGLRGK